MKPGVLRFGPQSDGPGSGAPPSILALQQQASQGAAAQQITLSGQSPQRAPTQLSTNSESVQQQLQSSISTYASSPAPTGQTLQGKILKSFGPEFITLI